MFAYYVRLALGSLRRSAGLTALMIGAIALGIGVCMTTLSIYHLMSSNPIEHKNDVLYAVQLDAWDPAEGFDEEDFPGMPPWELTYRDAQALRESEIASARAAMFKTSFVVQPERNDVNPFLSIARATDGDFFRMFDVPFVHGGAWDRGVDDGSALVAVISEEINDKVFGGEDSVGRRILLNDRYFEVTGVMGRWNPSPKFYDVNNGAFNDSEDIYVPFALAEPLELKQVGNVNCWKPEALDSRSAFLNSECVWIQYWVQLEGADERERFQSFLDDHATEQNKLGRFGRPVNNRLTTVADWLEVRRVVQDDNKVLVGLSFMFLAVCLLNTIGLLLARFIGKAPQISLRRALGASRRAMFAQHLVEVGIIGLLGGLLGLGLAYLGLIGVRGLHEDAERFAYLDVSMLFTGLVLALLASVAAGLYPTWRVCRMSPAPFLKTQ